MRFAHTQDTDSAWVITAVTTSCQHFPTLPGHGRMINEYMLLPQLD